MKFLPLLAANLLRKKVRTVLTVGSFAVALFLFCLLAAIRAAINQAVEVAGADRLLVISKVSIIQPLPFAYRDRILRVPGVKKATFASWFGGVYQDEKNFFGQFAIDQTSYRDLYTEFLLPDDQWQAFLQDKAGCVVGASTAARFGWKLGDRIPIRGAIYPGEWQFNLRGIYTGRRPNDDLTQFWFRWDYLQEKIDPFLKGYVGWYTLRVAPGHEAVTVTAEIDRLFANSTFETRTQTESALMASFVKQIGNVELLLLAIGSVVVFTLLLVTGNTMGIAVRERTGELAVLKTVGFSDRFVLALVLLEASVIAAVGGVLGVVAARMFTAAGDPTDGLLPGFYLPPWSVPAALALGLAVGVLAGLVPAVSAMRLQVVQALRRM